MTRGEPTETEKFLKRNEGAVWRFAPLLIAALVLLPVSTYAKVYTHLDRAIHAYQTALHLQSELSLKPLASQTEPDYEKVIKAFRNVYIADAHYSKAPVSLAMAGELYAQMGRQFHDPSASLKAVKAYKFLISQYPGSKMSRDALFTIGEIYRNDLQDNDRARKAFQEFLAQYPHSGSARAAKDNLQQIVKSLSRSSRENQQEVLAIQSRPADASGPPRLTDIRDWVGPNYTRVVIAVQNQVKFDTLRLSHPDRIVLDLQDTRLSHDLVGRTFPVNGGFLRRIRVGQFKPDVTRVVLDVQHLEAYSVFPLPNPFRLIIDVHGPEASRDTEQASRERLTRTAEQAARERQAEAKTTQHSESAAASPGESAGKVASVRAEQQKNHSETSSLSGRKSASGTVKTASNENAPAHAPAVIRAAAPTAAGSQTLTRALGLKVARIVIDPGHGGHDTGTIGPDGLEEKTVVLDVAKRLKKLLETRTGADVFLTRSTDKFIPLEERTAIANQDDADLFISIHANASRDREARGIETYYLNFTTDPAALEIAARENATSQESVHQLQSLIQKIALTEKVEESQEFARDVQRDMVHQMAKVGDREPNRGVKKAPFVVLIGANMPSILAEISFLTNPHDARLLHTEAFRQQIAEALFKGILDYMRNLGSVSIAERTHPSPLARKDPPSHSRKSAPDKANF